MEGRRDGTCGWKGANIVRLGYFCVVHHDFCLISIPIHCIYFCQEITPQHPNYESYFKLCFAVLDECLFGRPGSPDLRLLSIKERTFQD